VARYGVRQGAPRPAYPFPPLIIPPTGFWRNSLALRPIGGVQDVLPGEKPHFGSRSNVPLERPRNWDTLLIVAAEESGRKSSCLHSPRMNQRRRLETGWGLPMRSSSGCFPRSSPSPILAYRLLGVRFRMSAESCPQVVHDRQISDRGRPR
jgi:hypothetical protein